MVSMTLPSSRGCLKPKRTRLRAVKVYFESDVKSDPASQMFGEGEEVEDDIEDGEEEEGGAEIGSGETGAGATANEELTELRKQHREIRETLRTVKQERDQLLSDLDDFEAIQADNEGLSAQLSHAEEEIAQLRHQIEQWELGQPELIEELEELHIRLEETEKQRDEFEDMTNVSVRTADLQDQQYEAMNTSWVQKEDEWRADKSRMELERKKLVDRINSEGSAGAVRIKELRAAADAQESRILEYGSSILSFSPGLLLILYLPLV